MNNTKLLNSAGLHYFIGMIQFSNLKCDLPTEAHIGYSFIVHKGSDQHRVLVKTRSETSDFDESSTFPIGTSDKFDWIAVLIKFENERLLSWIIPIDIAIKHLTKAGRLSWTKLESSELSIYKNNWLLNR